MSNLKIQNDEYLTGIFESLSLQYERVDFDDDLNYFLSYAPRKLTQSIGVIDVLLFYSYETLSLGVLCPNIYNLKEDDSTLIVLNALNQTNKKLKYGNVTLDDAEVTYRCYKDFEKVEDIKAEKLAEILNDVVAAILFTYEEIKDII